MEIMKLNRYPVIFYDNKKKPKPKILFSKQFSGKKLKSNNCTLKNYLKYRVLDFSLNKFIKYYAII